MRCVHCLKEAKKTKDHVFPKSWYPNDTPGEIQRPTVPSCARCNHELGALESDLFIRLAMCTDPRRSEASGISSKALISLGVNVEDGLITNKEKEIRSQLLARILREMKPCDPNNPKVKPLKGVGFHEGYKKEDHHMINIPEKSLQRVMEKIMCGMEYTLNNKRYIELPFKLKVYFVYDGCEINFVDNLINSYGFVITYGPGFAVDRAEAGDGTKSVLYRVKIWDSLVVYGSIMV